MADATDSGDDNGLPATDDIAVGFHAAVMTSIKVLWVSLSIVILAYAITLIPVTDGAAVKEMTVSA